MGYVEHTGRVGALAIALGVGLAVTASPAICCAATDSTSATVDSSSAADGSASAEASAVSGGIKTADSPDASTTAVPGSPSTTAVPGSRSTTANLGDSTAGTSTAAVAETEADAQAEAISVDDVAENAGRGEHRPAVGESVEPPTAREPGTSDVFPRSDERTATQTDDVPTTLRQTIDSPDGAPSSPDSSPRDDVHLDRLDPAGAEQAGTSEQPGTSGQPTTPGPSSASEPAAATYAMDTRADVTQPVSTPTDPLTAVVTATANLLTTLLGPLLASGPLDPASPSPALWALAAWTRREIGGTGQGLLSGASVAITDVGVLVGRMVDPSIYDLSDWRGWVALISDYTWDLPGTLAGDVVHVVNFFWPGSNYRYDLSYHQNRHVYEGGFSYTYGFAVTVGNVISNAALNSGVVYESFIKNHEETHIWQERTFGPAMYAISAAWLVGGAVVGTLVWLSDPSEDWYSLVNTAAYYDNPFEYWAYSADDNWPPSGANPKLIW